MRHLKIMNGGELGNRKSINIPGTHINLPALKDKDIQDLIAGCKHGFDYISASFIHLFSLYGENPQQPSV